MWPAIGVTGKGGGGDKIDHGYGELYEGAKRGKFGLNTP